MCGAFEGKETWFPKLKNKHDATIKNEEESLDMYKISITVIKS